MSRCYCHGTVCGNDQLPDGARVVHVEAWINWGDNDQRANAQSAYDFGSFACIGLWAADRAADHDGHVLAHDVPPDPPPTPTPTEIVILPPPSPAPVEVKP